VISICGPLCCQAALSIFCIFPQLSQAMPYSTIKAQIEHTPSLRLQRKQYSKTLQPQKINRNKPLQNICSTKSLQINTQNSIKDFPKNQK
jgi:hypothetical protein